MEHGRKEGRKEGVKGARYDFVRAAAPAEREGREEKKKDLCISKNGRKTSARGRSRILLVRGHEAPLARNGSSDGRTDRQTGEIWTATAGPRGEPERGSDST